jgi:uncharacterized protein (TIGR04255 family)
MGTLMFGDAKIPRNLANSPISEAVFEIRYEGKYPGEALYGVLFDIFEQFPDQKAEVLPILQIPRQLRDMDPGLHYQPFYRVKDKNLAFSVGPHSIIFSVSKPYTGWTKWTDFFYPIIEKIKNKEIMERIERVGLRTWDILEGNIFDLINAKLIVRGKDITASPSSFYTEFDQNETHIVLNIGNAANVNGKQTNDSLIDIDCIHYFNSDTASFFSTYKDALEKAHIANKQIFFGLLKEELVNIYGPEY